MIEKRIIEAAALAEQNRKTQKQSAFTKLKTESPDSAQFLTDVAALFGKPSAIAIRFANGERFTQGRFQPAQEFADHSQRTDVLRQRWINNITRKK